MYRISARNYRRTTDDPATVKVARHHGCACKIGAMSSRGTFATEAEAEARVAALVEKGGQDSGWCRDSLPRPAAPADAIPAAPADAAQVTAALDDCAAALTTAAQSPAAAASLAAKLGKLGPSPRTAADVERVKAVLRRAGHRILSDRPSANSAATVQPDQLRPGYVHVGRVQGKADRRPANSSPFQVRWDIAMETYADHLQDAGFTIHHRNDHGLYLLLPIEATDAERQADGAPATPAPDEPQPVQRPQIPHQREHRPVDQDGADGHQLVHPRADRVATAALADAAAHFRLDAAGAICLRSHPQGAALFRLPNAGAVVRVGAPGTYGSTIAEVHTVQWLHGLGMPVALPLTAEPYLYAHRPVTAWTDLGTGGVVDAHDLGLLHQQLHSLPLPPAGVRVRPHNPWRRLPDRLHAARITTAKRDWLGQWADSLYSQWLEHHRTAPKHVVHGAAGPHHTLYAAGKPHLVGWQHHGIGDPLADLVHAWWQQHVLTGADPDGAEDYAHQHATAYGIDPSGLQGFELHWKIRTLDTVLTATATADRSAEARQHADTWLSHLIEHREASWHDSLA